LREEEGGREEKEGESGKGTREGRRGKGRGFTRKGIKFVEKEWGYGCRSTTQ